MATFTAFFDSSVLYPAPLRDFLMWLGLTDLFRAKWSDQVHAEWMASVLRDRPDLTWAQLERTRKFMNENVRDCLVEDFEDLINGLALSDPDDRHVLAAAIRGQADVILTSNLSDFPREMLQPFGIEAQHPNTFVLHLFDLSPQSVISAARDHRASLHNPPKEVDEYLHTLERQGLVQTASTLREFQLLLENCRHCLDWQAGAQVKPAQTNMIPIITWIELHRSQEGQLGWIRFA